MTNSFFKILVFNIFSVLLLSIIGFGQEQVPAFPGAEGYGKYTSGGRGGRVIYVTNLEDNTLPGSLRYAINQTGARTIVFSVSGTIQLKSILNIKNGNLTIAGQTAPGDGICLRDYTVFVDADNIIIRYLRFRMGDETKQENDCIWGRNRKDIIIDHCSMSWNTDECASFYDNTNFTMQWCLLSESLRNSVHGKGAHGYGGIWGGKNASFHHNLLANHDNRNPRFCGSRYSNKPDLELVDFRNNVIYNWGSNSIYAAEGGRYNLVNNYFKAGLATSSSSKSRIIEPYADGGTNSQPKGIYGKFFIDGNVMANSTAVTADNWLGVHPHSSFASSAPGVTKNDLKADTWFSLLNVTTHSAEIAYQKVLNYVGASLVRDLVDTRIIKEVQTGIPTYIDGGNGSKNGLIDTQSAVGGWPTLVSKLALTDTDQDGMPDVWEEANKLSIIDPNDASSTSLDGRYSNLEVYLNSLVASITNNQLQDALITSTISEKQNKEKINISYNRNYGVVKVNHQKSIHNIQVFSITGQLLNSESFSSKEVELKIKSNFSKMILVRIIDENRAIYSQKVSIF